MKQLFFYFSIIGLCSGCTHVVFDVPQPNDVKPLTMFPIEYRGVYHLPGEEMDSLVVSESTVTFIEHSTNELPVDGIDTMLHITLKDGLLYNAELMRSEGVPYQIDDSVIRYEYHDRHVIGISDTVVVKQTGKMLVVSSNFTDDDRNYWDVVLVDKPNPDEIRVSTIENLNPPGNESNSGNYNGELSYFEKFAPIETLSEDTYLFKPTPKQFRKLVKKKLFAKQQLYTRF